MADDKKSFIAYADWNETFKKLTDEEAGRLSKMLFSYVCDENPEPPDRITELLFEPLKQSLKRDLRKYENIREKRANAGRSGGFKSAESRSKPNQNEANEANALKTQANEAVSVSGSVNVSGSVSDILLEKETKEHLSKSENDDSVKTPEPEERKKVAPKKERPEPPDLSDFLNYARETYQNELKRDFSPFEFAVRSKYESWLNSGWKDGNGNQIKNWKSKLKNTIPHLKPIYNGTNNYTAGAANGNQKPAGKVSARTVLAQRLNAANAANGSGGGEIFDAEILQ